VDKVSSYISKGGDVVREGFIGVASFLSEGIKRSGDYISTKIDKKEDMKINPDTMMKVNIAKTTTNAFYTYSKTQVEGLVQIGKHIGGELAKNFENSETGQKMKNHPKYEDAKTIGKATVHAIAAFYDGLFEALHILGRGISSTTSNLVEQKYGKDAGDLSKASFDTVGNIGNITQVYKEVGSKQLLQTTGEKNPNPNEIKQ